jgi:hypothetical protein
MQTDIIYTNGTAIAHIISGDVLIHTAQDAVELMMNCSYQGPDKIIIGEENVVAGFFDLKTGIAGEILQKFSTYRCRLAIVGDFAHMESKSLRDFIYESNKAGRINFVASIEEAMSSLAKKSAG